MAKINTLILVIIIFFSVCIVLSKGNAMEKNVPLGGLVKKYHLFQTTHIILQEKTSKKIYEFESHNVKELIAKLKNFKETGKYRTYCPFLMSFYRNDQLLVNLDFFVDSHSRVILIRDLAGKDYLYDYSLSQLFNKEIVDYFDGIKQTK